MYILCVFGKPVFFPFFYWFRSGSDWFPIHKVLWFDHQFGSDKHLPLVKVHKDKGVVVVVIVSY